MSDGGKFKNTFKRGSTKNEKMSASEAVVMFENLKMSTSEAVPVVCS